MRFVTGILVVLIGLGTAQAQGQLYPPDGPFAVGRTAYQWRDDTRDEAHTLDDANDKRELLVEVWYPAEPGAQPGPYLESEMADLFTLMYNAPEGAINAIQANAAPDAPLANAQDQYPVVIFDPGFSVAPREYTLLLEELASQGYVVFAVSHPYVTRQTIFLDGRVIEPLSEDHLSSLWMPLDALDGEFENMWVPDVRFVLDQVVGLNTDDPAGRFTGRLNTEQIGLVGHSQGARTVSEVCLLDDRCTAAVNLDGQRSASVDLEFDKPYMLMLSDNGIKPFVTTFEHGLEAMDSDFYVIMIPKSNHMSFADEAFWSPMVLADSLDERAVAIAQITLLDYRLYLTSFLDKYVRGLDVPLLDGPSDAYPEVFFLSRSEPIVPPTANAEPQAAVLGGNIGSIEVGEADIWTYQGQAGEAITLWLMADKPAGRTTAEQREEYGLMDTLLVVRAPDGSLLATNDDAHLTTDSALQDLDLPEDGVYQIEVRTWESQTGGGYSLILEQETP